MTTTTQPDNPSCWRVVATFRRRTDISGRALYVHAEDCDDLTKARSLAAALADDPSCWAPIDAFEITVDDPIPIRQPRPQR